MGFIPLFLTLGASVFLFVMVVSTNLKNKRLQYWSEMELLSRNLDWIVQKHQLNFQIPERDWKAFEAVYSQLREIPDKLLIQELEVGIKPFINRAKQHWFQYNRLLKTKPYSFVASLMGHKPVA